MSRLYAFILLRSLVTFFGLILLITFGTLMFFSISTHEGWRLMIRYALIAKAGRMPRE